MNGVIAASRRRACNSVTAYDSTKGNTSHSNACSDSDFINSWYHDGVGTFPAVGDIIYTDDIGCSALDGLDKYYRHDGGVSFTYQIDGSGEVYNIDLC